MSTDAELFGTIAAGYASARPPVHPRVIERVRAHLGIDEPLGSALDVGCGSGLSTRPLQRLARHCLGIDPSAQMLRLGTRVAPEARFAVARAEALPVRPGSVDLITAAGSLNYADLDGFFSEAVRVLSAAGVLVVYDFSPGRRLRNSGALEEWFSELLARYPAPRDSHRRELDTDTLRREPSGLRLTGSERFEIGLSLDQAFYEDYLMTETNIAHAVQAGTPEAEIRAWCHDALSPIFAGVEREVLFEGYVAYMAI